MFLGFLTSWHMRSVPQGRICLHKLTWCYTEVEAADQACYQSQSQFPDTEPTSSCHDPVLPGVRHGGYMCTCVSHKYEWTEGNQEWSPDLPHSRRAPFYYAMEATMTLESGNIWTDCDPANSVSWSTCLAGDLCNGAFSFRQPSVWLAWENMFALLRSVPMPPSSPPPPPPPPLP